VVGVGCNRGTPAAEILFLIDQEFERLGFSILSIRNLASIDLKADEPGLAEAAETLRRPVLFFSAEEIRSITVPNPSEMVANHVGVPSVCEATALLSARRRVLTAPKHKTKNVTVAIAKASSRS
jgi:cobalt-precorrin 5A hydrolase